MRKIAVALLATLFMIIGFGQPVSAQNGYPEPEDLYINDYADLLTVSDAARVEALFRGLRQDHDIEATVLTISSVSDYGTEDRTIESFATNLFNEWGIGDPIENNGILLLVAVDDREVRIEVGSGYGSSKNRAMQRIIDNDILPPFRNGDFSRGIYRGAAAIAEDLTGSQPSSSTITRNVSPQTSSPSTSRPPITVPATELTFGERVEQLLARAGTAISMFVVGAVGVAGAWYRSYQRNKPRACSVCQMEMLRLDESADDSFLRDGQILEEHLNSVDYDVWFCTNCEHHDVYRYARWFSGHGNCPSCHHKTVKETTNTITHATYDYAGEREVISDCRHCDYYSERTEIIPQKTRSQSNSFGGGSSSGGSSFGGGSSSGGGASGSW